MEPNSASLSTIAKKPHSAWGTAAPVMQSKPDSLTEVMSEQLADRLHQEQESLRLEQLLRDEAMALSLQRQFDSADGSARSEGADCEEAPAPADSEKALAPPDSDSALAQLLQQQFDREYNKELKVSEDRMNRDQKVRVSLSGYRRPERSGSAELEPELDDDEEDEDYDLYADKDRAVTKTRVGGPGAAGMVTKHDPEVTGRRNAARMTAEFGLGFREGDTSGMDVRLDNRVYNALKRHSEGQERRRGARLRDKRDRGTAEAALDEKTRTALFKEVSAGRLASLGGVVATGKESVVLHAYCCDGSQTPAGKPMPPEVAIKVFKTSLNEFKARSDYVTGDFRVCKDSLRWQNPRKVMRVWCEKELLNLRRLAKLGLPCPRGLMLRGHVLIMSFIGEAGCAAPRLKDCRLTPEEWATAWDQAASHLCRLYTECSLVHADFSEYNLLWWHGTVWIIDVSQSVDVGHPKALEFLLRDCRNACGFFGRQGVPYAPEPEEMFNRVTGLNIPGSGEGFEKRLADHLASRQDFEGDRVHLEHGLERREYQFEHFFSAGQRQEEADVDEEDGDDAEEDDDAGDWLEAPEEDDVTGVTS